MTDDSLNALTRKELAQKARKRGIAGWHGMKKKELVEALLTVTQQRKRQGANGNGRARRREPAAAPERHSPVRLRIQGASPVTPVRDSLVAEVLDPHWVHLRWTLSGRMVAR